MTLLAIDPGRSKLLPSIGWATFREDGSEYRRGELTWDLLCRALWVRGFDDEDDYGHAQLWFSPSVYGGYRIHEIAIENFINNPTSRGGQTNGTSEVIGAVEILAAQAGVPFTRQPNTILPIAKLQAGYTQKLKHLPHQDAAYLHGYYYLVGKGVLVSKGLESTL